MKVRIFSALTMQEAMNQVKETLGRDAIILHTRKFRKGGIGGFFGREMVEVMAAVDNDVPLVTLSPATKPKPKTTRARTSGTPVRSLVRTSAKAGKNEIKEPTIVAVDEIDQEIEKPIKAFQQGKNKTVEEILKENTNAVENTTEASEQAVLTPLALPKLLSDKRIDTDKLDNTEALTVSSSDAAVEKNIETTESLPEDDLKSEISGMRQMLEQLLTKTKTVPTNPWYDYLIKREIQPGFAEQILKGFPYSLTTLNKNPEATKKMLYDRFIGYIRTSSGIQLDEQGECKKVALVGPTGVGKTTTLAKLAARFTLENQANVAFITSDTYRIAAVEQLKTYANILNIPLDVVYSPDEMKKCINKHQDKDIILIDTAGRSQYNEEQMDELREMLGIDESLEPHLVLSSTTKHQDALDIIDRFSICSSENIIFTKIDEARNIGNIFNIMYEFPELIISYITDGQSVPDDIHPAEPSYLTDILLRD